VVERRLAIIDRPANQILMLTESESSNAQS
jgi:hypothetical protein